MEARGTTPRVWADNGDLEDLVGANGPFVTVQLATDAEIDNAQALPPSGNEFGR